MILNVPAQPVADYVLYKKSCIYNKTEETQNTIEVSLGISGISVFLY